MGGMTPIILVGLAVALYYFSQQSSGGASLPADALPLLTNGAPVQLGSGQSVALGSQTITGPGYVYFGASENLYYVAAGAPTSAQLAAAQKVFGTPASSSGSSSSSSGSSGSSTSGGSTISAAPPASVQPATYKTPSGGTAPTPTTLAGLWTAIQSWAAADSNFAGSGASLSGTPYHWAFYLQFIWPNTPSGWSGAWPPGLSAVFPNVDLTQPMSATTFWTGMGGQLQKGGLSGLSGLSALGTLGAVSPFAVRGSGGWRA